MRQPPCDFGYLHCLTHLLLIEGGGSLTLTLKGKLDRDRLFHGVVTSPLGCVCRGIIILSSYGLFFYHLVVNHQA